MATGIQDKTLSSYSPIPQPAQAYQLDQVPKDMCSREVCETAQGIGCILDVNGRFNGSAILITPFHILVPRHCFLNDAGYILFNNGRTSQRIFASTLIDGEIDPLEGFKGDYKILLIEDEHNISPVKISVGVACGQSAQINYHPNGWIYLKLYESIMPTGNYAGRSDLASIETFPGDSGGARCSLNNGAVHSMHQGESEGIKMNDIVHSLRTICKSHPMKEVRQVSDEVIKKMVVLDLHALGTDFSSISLQSHHVRPEAPPQFIPKTVYRWVDSEGEKEAKKSGISINSEGGSIPTLMTAGKGAARSSGALQHYDRLLAIDTTLIPNLTYNPPILSGGGHWQFNITCDIPFEAITVIGRHHRR